MTQLEVKRVWRRVKKVVENWIESNSAYALQSQTKVKV